MVNILYAIVNLIYFKYVDFKFFGIKNNVSQICAQICFKGLRNKFKWKAHTMRYAYQGDQRS